MDKKELKKIIKEDKKIYFDDIGAKYFFRMLTKYQYYQIGIYIILCRKAGYYNLNRNGIINKFLSVYYSRKKNILGQKLNIEFGPNEFGRRLRIYHGNVVVNGYAKIGDDVSLYGSNCIGNKGVLYDVKKCPSIGNNVSLGVGAKIVGNIKIEDNVSISALSLVNKSILEKNVLYGGVPAKFIKRLDEK